MPATTTYNEMFSQFKRDIGVSSQYSEDGELAARFNGWFNDRLREIWRAARWTQCVAVEPCAVCTDGIVPLPCVVDNGDKINIFSQDPRSNLRPREIEFVLNDGWLWVGEKFASKLKENSNEYSGKSFSNCKTAILSKGDILFEKNWVNLASYAWNVFKYEGEDLYEVLEGAIVEESEIGSKWTKLSSLPFLPSVWLLYKSVPPNFNTDGIDTLTNKELLIPVFMKRYVQLATHSDYLRSLNRQDESESVLALAQKVLDEEIYRFETFSTKGEDIYGYR